MPSDTGPHVKRNMNLDYWYFTDVFNKKEIEEINSFIEQKFDSFEEDRHKATIDDKKIKFAEVKQIFWKKIKNLFKGFEQHLFSVNNEHFGYNLYSINDLDKCNLNIYSYKDIGQYDWHIDADPGNFIDIKLTVLINLSLDKYSGGSFKIFNGGKEYEVKELDTPGNAIMFKSYLNHKVTPVLNGERRTFVIFLKGPKLR